MVNKIKRAILVLSCSFLLSIVCFIFADILIANYEEKRLSAKNELIEVSENIPESEPVISTTIIPLVDIRSTPEPEEEAPIEEPSESTEAVVESEDESDEDPKPEPVEEVIEERPKKYTDDDVIAMAKLLYGEARGVKDLYIWDGRVISSEYQKACVIWSVLNRYDKGWENSIIATVSAYKQFHGYNPNNPVLEELVIISYDVLERWNREKYGETDVGRVLPSEYLYFYGDNSTNWFMAEYGSPYKYNWDLDDPYV